MNKESKNNKLIIIAVIFSIIAIGSASEISDFLTNVTCYNCTLDNPTFVNFSFNTSNISQDLLNLKVNKSGDNITGTIYMHDNNIDDISYLNINHDVTINHDLNLNHDLIMTGLGDIYMNGRTINGLNSLSALGLINSATLSSGELNLNGGNIINCGNCSDNLKWNKTDNINMSVDKNLSNYSNIISKYISNNLDINVNAYNITNASLINGNSFNAKSNEVLVPYSSNNIVTAFSNNSNVLDLRLASSGAYAVSNFIGGRKAGGTTNNLQATNINSALLWIFGGGYDGTSWSNSQIDIRLLSDSAWNTTSKSTKMEFYTTPSGAVNSKLVMKLSNSSNLEIIQPGKGITLLSPSSIPFCINVSDLGVLTTISGACT